MKEISVLSGEYIEGFEIIYEDDEGNKITTKQIIAFRRSSSSKTVWSNFLFQKNEYITKVKVRTGGWMDQFEFETNLGNKKSFGGTGGTEREIEMSVTPGKVARVVAFNIQHY